ncbi:MAG TPA: pseudouridine synthase [Candidatus Limnocylindrales bacterium]|nr:pseudouridine synthase [Candidatus Limnocylindrales bacterium]
MRLNQFIASSTGLSRRAADKAIAEGRVRLNDQVAQLGQTVMESDHVSLDNQRITPAVKSTTILLNKPVGYVCSRDGQGSRTVYDLLPASLHHLKPVGRLDKDSSGLLLMSNDGQLAYKLTHPKFGKDKIYKIALNKPLTPDDQRHISEGIMLDDGLSKLQLEQINKSDRTNWKVVIHEGRNRQIRRTFEALGHNLPKLHRTMFGPYKLDRLETGKYILTSD